MADLTSKLGDKATIQLEKKIKKVYAEASHDFEAIIGEHFSKMPKVEAQMKELVSKGQMTDAEFQSWRLSYIGRGERYEAMRDKLAERATQANEIAVSYINDATPTLYGIGRNTTAFIIEQNEGVDFNLLPEQTIKNLIVTEPQLMPSYPPEKAIDRGIDLAYGKTQIDKSVTSGILLGSSAGKIANDLQDRLANMERDSALRTARTATMSALNAGTADTIKSANGMGLHLRKQWLSCMDIRTRPAHAMANMQLADEDKPFKVGGEELMFPCDPDGSGWNVYNCRCTVRAYNPKHPYKGEDIKDYKTWEAEKYKSGQVYRLRTSYGTQEIVAIGEDTVIPVPAVQDMLIRTSGNLPHMNEQYTRWWLGTEDQTWNERFNRVDTTIAQLQEMYPLGVDLYAGEYDSVNSLLTSIQIERKSSTGASGQFWVNPKRDHFVIGFNPVGVSNTLAEDIAIREQKIKSGEKLLSVLDNSPEGVAIHEYGHAYAEKLTVGMIYEDKNSLDYWEWYNSLSKSEIEKGLSWYATQSRAEFEAECFAELMCPNPRELARKYKEFLVNCRYSCYIYDVDNPPISNSPPKFKIPNKVFGSKVINLPKEEYGQVIHELETWMSEDDRKETLITKTVGKYNYTMLFDGTRYVCINKVQIVKEWEDL